MDCRRAVILFSSLWLICSVLTYVHPIFIEPNGDGFTRGLNRLGAALGWQAAASLFALLAYLAGVGKLASSPLFKWISRIPGIIQLLLIFFMVGLIVYLRFSKPAPVSDPPATPPTQTAPNPVKSQAEPFSERYTGIFHSGFERSHFYAADGRGPWWVEADEAVWEILERYRVDGPGPSGGIWVGLDVEASVDNEVDGLSHLGNFEGRMTILTIGNIRQLKPEAFEQLQEGFSQATP